NYDPDLNRWMMGKEEIKINKNSNIIVNDTEFKGTKGLYELLFKQHPGTHTLFDLRKYKSILELTNSHKLNFEANRRNRGNKSYKYMEIIKPLFKSIRRRSFSVGHGNKLGIPRHPLSMVSNDIPKEYIYWNDINELVNRLKDLYSSTMAGNNAHHNEIVSILEELQEEGIIR